MNLEQITHQSSLLRDSLLNGIQYVLRHARQLIALTPTLFLLSAITLPRSSNAQVSTQEPGIEGLQARVGDIQINSVAGLVTASVIGTEGSTVDTLVADTTPGAGKEDRASLLLVGKDPSPSGIREICVGVDTQGRKIFETRAAIQIGENESCTNYKVNANGTEIFTISRSDGPYGDIIIVDKDGVPRRYPTNFPTPRDVVQDNDGEFYFVFGGSRGSNPFAPKYIRFAKLNISNGSLTLEKDFIPPAIDGKESQNFLQSSVEMPDRTVVTANEYIEQNGAVPGSTRLVAYIRNNDGTTKVFPITNYINGSEINILSSTNDGENIYNVYQLDSKTKRITVLNTVTGKITNFDSTSNDFPDQIVYSGKNPDGTISLIGSKSIAETLVDSSVVLIPKQNGAGEITINNFLDHKLGPVSAFVTKTIANTNVYEAAFIGDILSEQSKLTAYWQLVGKYTIRRFLPLVER